MPDNAKKTGQCSFCKVRITGKNVPDTKLENNTDNEDTDSKINLGWKSVDFDDPVNLFQSDVCNPGVVITKVTTGQAEKTAPLAQLTAEHFELVRSPDGWQDCNIVHQVHVYLSEINLSIRGFQRPTLGPCKNFDVITGEFIQILHTGNYHWVCVSSIGCLPGMINLYDSLDHNVFKDEIEEQVKDLVAGTISEALLLFPFNNG